MEKSKRNAAGMARATAGRSRVFDDKSKYQRGKIDVCTTCHDRGEYLECPMCRGKGGCDPCLPYPKICPDCWDSREPVDKVLTSAKFVGVSGMDLRIILGDHIWDHFDSLGIKGEREVCQLPLNEQIAFVLGHCCSVDRLIHHVEDWHTP